MLCPFSTYLEAVRVGSVLADHLRHLQQQPAVAIVAVRGHANIAAIRGVQHGAAALGVCGEVAQDAAQRRQLLHRVLYRL
eukprot:254943-Chlamydomonas_euryale.AAC.2